MRYVYPLFGILVLISRLLFPHVAYAEQKVSGTSRVFITYQSIQQEDRRVKILKNYLHKYDSPLEDYADVFVVKADKYNLDWKMVASISGVESWFGQQLPYNSHNAWGYGIYGTNSRSFASYGEAIEVISKSLREDYMDKWGAKDVYQIGGFYAADPAWAQKVTHFMNELDAYATPNPKDALSITL